MDGKYFTLEPCLSFKTYLSSPKTNPTKHVQRLKKGNRSQLIVNLRKLLDVANSSQTRERSSLSASELRQPRSSSKSDPGRSQRLPADPWHSGAAALGPQRHRLRLCAQEVCKGWCTCYLGGLAYLFGLPGAR